MHFVPCAFFIRGHNEKSKKGSFGLTKLVPPNSDVVPNNVTQLNLETLLGNDHSSIQMGCSATVCRETIAGMLWLNENNVPKALQIEGVNASTTGTRACIMYHSME